MYVSELIKEECCFDAVKVFLEYGTSTNAQNFNIYRALIHHVIDIIFFFIFFYSKFKILFKK